MKTLRLRGENAEDVAKAAALLRDGGTVAFPTETVYGLGANAMSEAAAVEKIFAAKQRPAWDPLIVHVAGVEDVAIVAAVNEALSERVMGLAAAFWPGPLTLLLPRRAAVPDAVTAGRALVGVRVPRHPLALRLLRMAGVPVAAPSANTFGHISPTTAEHVLADLDGRIDAVLDGGATDVGVESTVLDPAAMMIYRPGAVTAEDIARVCGCAATLYVAARTLPVEALPSPGVGIRHYAPRARLVLTAGNEPALEQAVATLSDAPVGVMLPRDWSVSRAATAFDWGAWDATEQLAAKLYAGLRALDDAGVAVIFCPSPEGAGMAAALRDRLEKAARAE